MSYFDTLHRTPAEKTLTHSLRFPDLSYGKTTILTMIAQILICGLIWAFAIIVNVRKAISLPDFVASWVFNHPSNTNLTVNVICTILATIESYFLGLTIQHALAFRLPHGLPLFKVEVGVKLAQNSPFFHPRRYLFWTIMSLLWIAMTSLLTPAWSNLLTPLPVFRQRNTTTREFDFLNPTFADYAQTHLGFPSVSPMNRTYSMNPRSFKFLGNTTGYFYQAGNAAASAYVQPGYPVFTGNFNSSTGGVNPTSAQNQLSFPTLQKNYQGISTSYTLTQQGYTANVSCRASFSPTMTLVNNDLVQYTYNTPSNNFEYALERWSWSTNCSGNGNYYAGEANLLTSNGSFIGNGLFATSVCFYQDFSGPSSKSFLVLMQSPNNSAYGSIYFADNPDWPIVCEVTPIVTTLQVQYNQSGLADVITTVAMNPLPDNSWILVSVPGIVIWATYFLAQGPYSNAFADGLMATIHLGNATVPSVTRVLEQYLRGIFEYMGSEIRGTLMARYWTDINATTMVPPPANMSVEASGTMTVQFLGWKSHPQTHGFALMEITLVTAMTVAAGMYALVRGWRHNVVQDPAQRVTNSSFDPTDLVEFAVATSMGNLAEALSKPGNEKYRDQLVVELDRRPDGYTSLNVVVPPDRRTDEYPLLVQADRVEGVDHPLH